MISVLLAVLLTILITLFLLNFTPGEKKIQHRVRPHYSVRDEQFYRSMGNLLGPSILDGNRVSALYNGNEIFPAMLDAIRKAQVSISFETYIYWSGEIGKTFADALIERAQKGVKVHVLIDWIGSGKINKRYMQRMKEVGIAFDVYHPLRWSTLPRMNNRTHRKILVIDGKVGFTGGAGIADQWLGNADSPKHWRDSHFRLEGPAVSQLQAAFMDNWLVTRSEVLHGDDYFPPLEKAGDCQCQVFQSSPGEGSESVRLMFLLSIGAARESIKISHAYFIPDNLILGALVTARKRGVKIEIILPGTRIDVPVVRAASRSLWYRLLKQGVGIYEYQPTMFHCKVMIVDNFWVSVGSTNMDNRSFRFNDEVNLNILNEEFAAKQIQVFEEDKKKSKRVTLNEWKKRPLSEKLHEFAAGLLKPQL